jgi:hypothetical protein
MLDYLVSPDLILILALLQLSLLLRLQFRQSLCRLFFIFMHFLQPTLSIHHFLAGEMHLDTFDFLINRLLVVLSPRLHLLLEQLLRGLLNLFKVIIEVLVKHTPVEVVKDPKFDGTDCLQSVSLRFFVFDI